MGKRKRFRSKQPPAFRILSSLYPPASIRTLQDAIISLLVPSFPSRNAARRFLLHCGGSTDYVSLLQNGYAVLSEIAPPIGVRSLEQRWTHQELKSIPISIECQVIERAIQIQFRQGKNASNVLCFGFEQPRPTLNTEADRITLTGLARVSDNAAIAILNTEVWREIHTRVGDSIMLYFLSHADIFHPLPGRCIAQIAGASVLLGAKSSAIESCNRKKAKRKRGGKNAFHEECQEDLCFQSYGERVTNNKATTKNSYTEVSSSSKRRLRFSCHQHCKVRKCANQDVKATSGSRIWQGSSGIKEGNSSSQMITCVAMADNAAVCSGSKSNENKSCMALVPDMDSAKYINGNDLSSLATQDDLKDLDVDPIDLASEDKPHSSVNTKQCNVNVSVKKSSSELTRSLLFSKSNSETLIVQGMGMGKRIINRSRMFYKSKFPHHAGLPKNHLLCKLKCTFEDAAVLFKNIFAQQSTGIQCGLLYSEKYLKWMYCLLKRMISNAKHCQYARLLERHCPSKHLKTSEQCLELKKTMLSNKKDFVSQKQNSSTLTNENNFSSPDAEAFSSHNQIAAFIWAVCRRIVPETLLGTQANWRALRRNIFCFINLRRYECFTLQQCMFQVKISGYPWCQEENISCFIYDAVGSVADVGDVKFGGCREKSLIGRYMLEKWIYWLFSSLIVPLIQSHFYVTESEKYRQDVLFYRKGVWAKMKGSSIAELQKSNFKKLSTQSTIETLKDRSLGFSRARLLPKRQGMRLIVNLGSSSTITYPFRQKQKDAKVGGHVVMSANHVSVEQMLSLNSKCISRDQKSAMIEGCRSDAKHVTVQSKSTFKPVNVILRDLHYCLKFEQERHNANLGCSVFDYNDIYMKLVPFIVDIKSSPNNAHQLYLVVCDILQAYDTIKQDKLISIMQEFVHEPEYSVRRYCYVSRTSRSTVSLLAKPIKAFRERVAVPNNEGISYLKDFMQFAAKHVNAVCVDQAHTTKLKKNYINRMLHEHISRNIVQIGQSFYLQVVGIPQGSILSSLLCSLYFGHLERCRLASALSLNHLSSMQDEATGQSPLYSRHRRRHFLKAITAVAKCQPTKNNNHNLVSSHVVGTKERPRNILLRLVDDYLFVTDSQDNARDFIVKMHKGFADYNCIANKQKTAVSFDTNIGGSQMETNVYVTDDGACYMRWSGLLINCNTLEIQADYTRYAGVNIKSTLTVWRGNNQGRHLITKLCQFMRPKCHPLFYDTNINSPATTLLNAYQSFLLCGMKFHAYNCSLPYNGKCNPEFGFKAIKITARYMHSLLEHRTKKISDCSQVKPIVLLHARDVDWLAFQAFHKVLLRKQSRYQKLIHLIEAELETPRYYDLRSTPAMSSALDPQRSSMFKYIIY